MGQPRAYPGSHIVAIIDGDTMDVDIDYGFHCHQQHRLRLQHINAPEHGTPAGTIATAFATAWLATRPTVTVTTERNPHTGDDIAEKYGRYLAVITDPTGASLNQAMLDSGNAVPYEGGPR